MGCKPSGGQLKDMQAGKIKSSSQKTTSGKAGQRNFHDDYKLGLKIGRGAFAQVRLTTKVRRTDHGKVEKNYQDAVKILDLRNKTNPQEIDACQKRAVHNEHKVWTQVGRHPHVIGMIDSFVGEPLSYFVMERCASDLMGALMGEGELNERTIGRYLDEMAQGIAHVHSMNVVHRDIKPDNFLVGGQDGKQVKLGDFGLSATLDKQKNIKGVFGTAPFMCPEMLDSNRYYNTKADVWSFAVIVYVFFFGRFPYLPKEQTSAAMKEAISRGEPPPRFSPSSRTGASNTTRSPQAMKFAGTLLVRDPDMRPTMEDVLEMPYIKQVRGDPTARPWPQDMPSLRPMIHAAKKVGAFEVRDVKNSDSVDYLLNKFQMMSAQGPLPLPAETGQTPKTCAVDNTTKAKSREPREPRNDDTTKPRSRLPPIKQGTKSADISLDWETSSTELPSDDSSLRSDDFVFKRSGRIRGVSRDSNSSHQSDSDASSHHSHQPTTQPSSKSKDLHVAAV